MTRLLILNWKDIKNPDAGGAEVFVHELARRWAGWGYDVALFTRMFPGASPDELVDDVQVIRRGNRFSVYREARKWFSRNTFDAIFESVNTRPFMTPSFRPRVPTVTLFHQLCAEIWEYEFPRPIAAVGRYWLEPRWLRRYENETVLAQSHSTESDLRDAGLRDVRRIPIGVSLPERLPGGPKEPKPTLVFVGRLAANKRPDHAASVFSLVRASIPSAQLWIVGSGPMEAELKSRCPDAHFFGRVSQQEKFELMARAHILVATSVREGWGLVVTEAASVGTLPIGYDVPGLRDSISEAGGILVPESPGSMASTIVSCLKNGAVMDFKPITPTSWDESAKAALVELERAASARTTRS